MRVSPDEAAGIHFSVENSELYDRELKMYRLCAPLHRESPELGRITAFTPGIFERESIFPHAEFKYLLSMLDVGLYEELFERLGQFCLRSSDRLYMGEFVLHRVVGKS